MKTIYKTYFGSKAHGLYMDESEYGEFATCDIDIMEFFTYDLKWYLSRRSLLTPNSRLTLTEKSGEYDIVKHELRKGIDLLVKGNPNMLVMLFTSEDNILKVSKGGNLLRLNRELFLSKLNIKERFKGYAYDQLSRLQREVFKGYMGDKRKKIVEKFGYDTKNAMTLIRLLHEAVEVLKTGNITVDKIQNGMRDYFIDIKIGKWSLDKIKHEAELLSKEVDRLYTTSSLPELADNQAIDILSQEIFKIDVLESN